MKEGSDPKIPRFRHRLDRDVESTSSLWEFFGSCGRASKLRAVVLKTH